MSLTQYKGPITNQRANPLLGLITTLRDEVGFYAQRVNDRHIKVTLSEVNCLAVLDVFRLENEGTDDVCTVEFTVYLEPTINDVLYGPFYAVKLLCNNSSLTVPEIMAEISKINDEHYKHLRAAGII